MDSHHLSTLTCVLKKSCSHKISQGHDEDGTSEDINNQQYRCRLLIFLPVSNRVVELVVQEAGKSPP